MKKVILYISIVFLALPLVGQGSDADDEKRIQELKIKLESLAKQTVGLNNEGNISFSGVSIQEVLRGLAQAHDLNINVDPSLDIKVYNRFTNEKVYNIILFLCKEYGLDIRTTGTIMSFYKVEDKPIVVKEDDGIEIVYDKLSDKLNLDLRQAGLMEVARTITEQTGNNVIVAPNVSDKKINLFLKDVNFEPGIEKLAYASGLSLNQTDDGFFVLEKDDEPEQPGNRGNSRNSRGRNRQSQGENLSGTFEISVDGDLLNIDAIDYPIGELIKMTSEKLNKNYFLFSEPKENTTTRVSGVTYEEFLAYILKGTSFTYKKRENIFLIGERKHESLRKTKVLRLQHRPAEELVESIPGDMKKDLEITPFVELNSLILSGSNPAILEVEEFIKELDQLVPVVLIEVIIVELKKGKTTKTGVRAGISDSTVATQGTFLPGIDFTLSSNSINDLLKFASGGFINLGRVTPNFYMSLSALEANENVDITSTPKLATLNGHEATLSIGRTNYYLVEQTNSSTGLTPVLTTNQQWNNVQANLEVKITPVVSADEYVTLDVNVTNSDFAGEAVDNRPPNTVNSTFASMIRVKNEEMIVLGGLEKLSKTESGTGTPILSSIPIIKWFFSSRSKSKSKEKSLIFIKPTIIYK